MSSTTQVLSVADIPDSDTLRTGGSNSHLSARPPHPLDRNYSSVFHPDQNTTFVCLFSPPPVATTIPPLFGGCICVHLPDSISLAPPEYFRAQEYNSCPKAHDSADLPLRVREAVTQRVSTLLLQHLADNQAASRANTPAHCV